MKKDLRGTWPQALGAFLWPILLILGIRWALIEPYVIPSGSMIPNLLISDHILVQKWSYGLRVPFSEKWLLRWGSAQAGDAIVFRYPESPSVFYIKRLIGLPGDQIRLEGRQLSVNGKLWPLTEISAPSSDEDTDEFTYFLEQGPNGPHHVRWATRTAEGDSTVFEWTVPEGEYFFVGDNRDQSSDSRSWGFVPERHLLGKAWMIWLSCDRMLESAPFLCHPSTLRWERILTRGGL